MAGAPAEEKRHQRQKIKAECLFYLTDTYMHVLFQPSALLNTAALTSIISYCNSKSILFKNDSAVLNQQVK